MCSRRTEGFLCRPARRLRLQIPDADRWVALRSPGLKTTKPYSSFSQREVGSHLRGENST